MKKKKTAYKQFDAIVLGSGVAGYGAAIGLARLNKKVLMIGRPAQAGESSPASAGILDPYLDMHAPTPLFHLNRAAFYDYPSWLKFLERTSGLKSGYQRFGMLYAAYDKADEKKMQIWQRWQKHAGIRVQKISQLWLKKKEPGLNPSVHSGLVYPQIGRIQPRQLLRMMEKAAKKIGIQVLKSPQESVLKISNGRVQGITFNGKFFATETVVNATGSWAGATKKIGVCAPVFPVRGQILVARGKGKMRHILHDFHGNYIVPWGKNEYLLGSTVEKAGFAPRVTPEGFQKIKKGNERLFPALAKMKIVKKWAGLRPCAHDYMPIIGPCRIRGLYLACGYYRSGILISGYAGRLLAKGIQTGRMPGILKPFAPSRFDRS